MTPGRLAALFAAASLIALPAAPAFAQSGADAQRIAASAAAPADVQPEAVAAMVKMSAYLRSLQAFELRSDTVREEVNDNGQTLQFLGTTTYQMQRPSGFTITMAEDRQVREIVYDGKSVTLFAPRMGYYATVEAPPTIKELFDALDSKYGITIPLEDLFLWGGEKDWHAALTAAYWVGYARVAGQDADQYAFRQKGLDWQIWIARGDRPLPLRVELTSTDEAARPQFAASLSWDVAPKFAADTFTFTPPKDANKIVLTAQK